MTPPAWSRHAPKRAPPPPDDQTAAVLLALATEFALLSVAVAVVSALVLLVEFVGSMAP
jgi:hypothetical protein